MILFMCLQICPSCRPGNGLVQETVPAESAMVDLLHARTGRIRSIYCDILVEPVDGDRWGQLMRTRVYRKPGRPPLFRRPPPVTAFLVVLKNTVNAPLRLENVQVISDGMSMDALTADRISARFKSPSYAWCDFGRMLTFRRLVEEPRSMKRIDFDRDTIDMKLDFVPPRDSVIRVIAFERMPVEIRRFKLRFSVAAMGSVREIAVEFTRNEYRDNKKKKQEEIPDDDE